MNVIYFLLIEQGDTEQVRRIDEMLDAPMSGTDGYDPERERALLAAITGPPGRTAQLPTAEALDDG